MKRFSKYSLSKLILIWAIKVIKPQPVNKEWKTAIISLALVKIGTMVVSAYAAYFFFFAFINKVIHDETISRIITLITLLLLESITAIFLAKTFKFSFRKKYSISFIIFLVVGGFYFISFVSSTNGLAQSQARNVDRFFEIKKELIKEKQQLKKENRKIRQGIDNLIQDIRTNPIAWSGRKRVFLSKVQQNNIIELEQKKSAIRKMYATNLEKITVKFKNEMNANKKQMSNTAHDYYLFMVVVMVIQFFVTGILIFFLHLIYQEEHEQTHEFMFAHKKVDSNMNIEGKNDIERYLKKHEKIAQTLYAYAHKNQTYLSNSAINNKILPLLKGVKYKSPSLIRKVFAKMQLVGIACFNNNENVLN